MKLKEYWEKHREVFGNNGKSYIISRSACEVLHICEEDDIEYIILDLGDETTSVYNVTHDIECVLLGVPLIYNDLLDREYFQIQMAVKGVRYLAQLIKAVLLEDCCERYLPGYVCGDSEDQPSIYLFIADKYQYYMEIAVNYGIETTAREDTYYINIPDYSEFKLLSSAVIDKQKRIYVIVEAINTEVEILRICRDNNTNEAELEIIAVEQLEDKDLTIEAAISLVTDSIRDEIELVPESSVNTSEDDFEL